MDLNDYWQENKRFVLTVLGGAIVFMIGNQMIDSFVGSKLRSKINTRAAIKRDLKESRFLGSDLNVARSENQALRDAQTALAAHVAYPTREEFRLSEARGSAGNQYFAEATRVREDILRRAGRVNVRIAQDLGLPALAPTRDDEIARYLDALDLIERVLNIAVDEHVDRVDQIEIKVDPGLRGRKGVGRVEKTQVKMKMSGPSGPMLRLLVLTQDPSRGEPILIEQLEINPERTKEDEVKLEITFIAPRLSKIDTDETEL